MTEGHERKETAVVATDMTISAPAFSNMKNIHSHCQVNQEVNEEMSNK
jgi:stress-induced morphogen